MNLQFRLNTVINPGEKGVKTGNTSLFAQKGIFQMVLKILYFFFLFLYVHNKKGRNYIILHVASRDEKIKIN